MSTTPDKLVERYLKHLEVELDDVPRDRRGEIVDEIAGHIAEARAGLEHETEADVRNILEGLGDPAEIAEDARERFEVERPAPPRRRAGWIEVGALIMLLVGGLVLPIVGWLIGLVLLWVSNAWNVRDKIIGTLFVPGGLGLAFFVLALGLSAGGTSCGPIISGRTGVGTTIEPTCETASSTNYFAIAGLIVLILLPLVTTGYLAHRLRRHPANAMA
jgi:uncharacterized membrane protein